MKPNLLFLLTALILSGACNKNESIEDYSTEEIFSELSKRPTNDLISAGYIGKVKSVEINFYNAKWEDNKINEGDVVQQSTISFNEHGYKTSLYVYMPMVKSVEYLWNEYFESYSAKITEVGLTEQLKNERVLDDKNRIISKIKYLLIYSWFTV